MKMLQKTTANTARKLGLAMLLIFCQQVCIGFWFNSLSILNCILKFLILN